MENIPVMAVSHPGDADIAGFLESSLPPARRRDTELHLASCEECLTKALSAFEAVKDFNSGRSRKKDREQKMKMTRAYPLLAAVSFLLSFVWPRHFLQLLAAAVIFSIKWIADSRSSKTLVMIHEAWRSGGAEEASKVLQRLDGKNRIKH